MEQLPKRKFRFRVDTATFNKIVGSEAFRIKYERFTVKYQHNVDDNTSTAYFSEEAPEKEIMKFVQAEFGLQIRGQR